MPDIPITPPNKRVAELIDETYQDITIKFKGRRKKDIIKYLAKLLAVEKAENEILKKKLAENET